MIRSDIKNIVRIEKIVTKESIYVFYLQILIHYHILKDNGSFKAKISYRELG